MSSSNNNNNNAGGEPSMGEIFQQRRAAAAANKTVSNNNNTTNAGGGGEKKKSLLEIQAEQANEQQQQQQQPKVQMNNSNNNRGNNNAGGGGMGGRNRGGNNNNNNSGGQYSPTPPSGGRNNNNSNNSNRSNSQNQNRRGGGGGGAGSNSGGGGGRRGGGGNAQNWQHLPMEQGVVCTLKESFGFLKCVDRPDELFFHFSEVVGGGANELKLWDEVEYRVGNSPGGGGGGGNRNGGGNNSSEEGKVAALQVRKLPAGTIVWETEDEPGKRYRGIVDRAVRSSNQGGSSAALDGTIRVLTEKSAEGEETTTAAADVKEMSGEEGGGGDGEQTTKIIASADGRLVRFTAADYTPSDESNSNNNNNNNNSGGGGGGGNNSAHNNRTFNRGSSFSKGGDNRLCRGDLVEFSVFTDRPTKSKFARNIVLLQSEKDRRRQEEEKRMLEEATEEHGVVTALKGDYGFLRSNKRREDVYFHYSHVNSGDEDDPDAAKDLVLKEGQEMKFLVVTEIDDRKGGERRISARNVRIQPQGTVKFHDLIATGMTGEVSVCPQPVDSGHALDQQGKIRLNTPLEIDMFGEDEKVLVHEVYLRSKDSPGGNFSFRGGTSVGLFIQQGDTLLFDVVRDTMDGACRAIPTKYLKPRENPSQLEPDDHFEQGEEDPAKAIRLIGLAWAMRADGIVNAVRDNYGFIHFSERPVDVHFKLHQVLPDALQNDLRRNMGLADVDDKGAPLKLAVDAEVSFDLSVHGTIHSSSAGNRHHRGRNVQQQQPHERENLKAQRILFLPPGTVQLTKVLATDIEGVVSKADIKQPHSGAVDVEHEIHTMSLEERHPFVAKMIDHFLESNQQTPLVFHDIQSAKEDDIVIELLEQKAKGKLTWTHIPTPADTGYSGRLCIRKVQGDTVSEDTIEADIHHEDGTDDHHEASGDEGLRADGKLHKKKKHHPKVKTLKTVRFEKPGLVPELRDGISPGVGDIVRFDVVQSRRTGQVLVENMRIVKRAPENEHTAIHAKVAAKEAEAPTSGVGIIKELNRNTGVILVHDENASKRETLIFNFANVAGPSHDRSSKSPKKKGNPPLRKGDEVKFDIGHEGGKRVALNVSLVTKGSIANKPEKTACRGIVLLEPSHSSLKNTPLRHANSVPLQHGEKSGLSRWDSAEDDRKSNDSTGHITEQGCILLLEDPEHVFIKKPVENKTTQSADGDASPNDSGAKETASSINDSQHSGESDVEILHHLRYKTGAVAISGSGSSADDASSPRRGDLVSFGKVKSGKGLRDIRLITRGAATLLRGHLKDLPQNRTDGLVTFVADKEKNEEYVVSLSEIVSCDPAVLKENEAVEGILHDGRIYGICRTADLYLESKLGVSHKERPKLNLTVKKDRGGKIMAQSMMAKGPDGTNGFHKGWTKRLSRYAPVFQPSHPLPLPSPPTPVLSHPIPQTFQAASPAMAMSPSAVPYHHPAMMGGHPGTMMHHPYS